MQSPDFVSGSAGWQIRRDGSVEFNDGVFRGTVTAGMFEGTDYIINSAGIFLYSGTPANGNLLLAIAQSAGSDAFGNAYSAGITSADGLIVQNEDGFFVYGTSPTQTVTFTSSGTWTAPAGVTSVKVECWGAGGGGSSVSGSGGGGEYAAEPANTVVPGDVYTITVGTGGSGGAANMDQAGGNGGNTSFSGTSAVTVTAHGGGGGSSTPVGTPAPGGTGSSNTTHFDGGSGNVSSVVNPVFFGAGGCGGGSSAGTGSAGTKGNASTSLTGAAGGTVTGGGSGGKGGTGSASSSGATSGSPGAAPGGGGGGGGLDGNDAFLGGGGGAGAAGQVRVTYSGGAPSLLASIAASSGTDPFGNAYLIGLVSYSLSGTPRYAAQNYSGQIVYYQASSAAGPWSQLAAVIWDAANSALQIESGIGTTAIELTASDVQVSGQLTATGGTASAPTQISTDSWNAVSTPTGMTGTVRVKLLPLSNSAILDVNVIITSTNTTATAYTTGNLPSSSYYPAGARQYDLTVNQKYTATSNASPRINIPTSGALTFDMPAFASSGASCIVSGTIIYPLD